MDTLERLIERLVDELLKYKEVSDMLKIRPMSKRYYRAHQGEILWELLWYNGHHTLIERLAMAERDPDPTPLVVPAGGFTGDEVIDTIVVDWCKSRGIRLFNVSEEVRRLTAALHHTDVELIGATQGHRT